MTICLRTIEGLDSFSRTQPILLHYHIHDRRDHNYPQKSCKLTVFHPMPHGTQHRNERFCSICTLYQMGRTATILVNRTHFKRCGPYGPSTSVSDELRTGERHCRRVYHTCLDGIASYGLYSLHGIEHVAHEKGVVDDADDLPLPDQISAANIQSEPAGELVRLRIRESLHEDPVIGLLDELIPGVSAGRDDQIERLHDGGSSRRPPGPRHWTSSSRCRCCLRRRNPSGTT